jgi:hypothetical protein
VCVQVKLDQPPGFVFGGWGEVNMGSFAGQVEVGQAQLGDFCRGQPNVFDEHPDRFAQDCSSGGLSH